MWKQYEVRWRYLISYLLLFLMPFSIVSIYLIPRISDMSKENTLKAAESRLDLISQTINDKIYSSFQNVFLIADNPDLSSSVFREKNEINSKLISKELKKIFSHTTLTDNVYFYNKLTGYIHGLYHTYRHEWFNASVKSGIYFPDWPQQEMYAYLDNVTKIDFFPQQKLLVSGFQKQAVTVCIPVPYDNIYSYGILLIIIPTENLFSEQSEEMENIIVADSSNNVIAYSQEADYLESEEFLNLLESRSDSYYAEVRIEGVQYLFCQKQSPSSLLKTVSLTPMGSIMTPVYSIQRSIVFLLAGTSIVGLLFIFLLTKYNYVPIRRIYKQVQLLLGNGEPDLPNKRNELDTISQAINTLQDKYQEILSQMLKIRNVSQEYFLIQYLNGGLKNEEDIIQYASIYNVKLNANLLCVAFCETDKMNHSLPTYLEELLNLSRNDGNSSCYVISGTAPADFIIILFFEEEKEIKPFIYKLYSLPPSIKVGVGTIESLYKPAKSNVMSLVALEAALFNHNINIAQHDDVSIKNIHFISQLYDQLRNFEIAVAQKRAPHILELFEQIMDTIFEQSKRIFIIQGAYMNLLNTLARALNQYEINADYCYSVLDIPIDAKEMKDKLQEMYGLFWDALQNDINISESGGANIDISLILSYLENNYTRSDLSLAETANNFNLTYSNLSHFFKSKMDETFSSYLEKLRIDHAKTVLVNTDDTIEQIAEKVGYSNANSFTRAFRKREVFSPSAYRKSKHTNRDAIHEESD